MSWGYHHLRKHPNHFHLGIWVRFFVGFQTSVVRKKEQQKWAELFSPFFFCFWCPPKKNRENSCFLLVHYIKWLTSLTSNLFFLLDARSVPGCWFFWSNNKLPTENTADFRVNSFRKLPENFREIHVGVPYYSIWAGDSLRSMWI